jgi:TolB-like protein/tetratricopeptide (TPR) repeat protein/predicted Ser/Thr protein kinase
MAAPEGFGGARLPVHDSEVSVARWARVKTLFGQAIELPTEARAGFVAKECAGDLLLKREVESLLESDENAGSFCETPAAGLLADAGSCGAPALRFHAGSMVGAYAIEGFVGSGGMGEVYRARDTRLGREVAIKTVNAVTGGSAARAALMREAQHASSLAHPSICTIHEVGEVDGLPFIVMQLVDGRPLSDLVREGPLDAPQAIVYALQIASALDHAHARGVVHRDLKSSNVVVTRDDRPVVLDFGLARRLRVSDRTVTETTMGTGGAVAGTLSHMAPELLVGRRADARTDVWALGVLLYEMLTGDLPFRGHTAFETSSAIIGEPPRPMPRSVPSLLRAIVQRCLAKEPDARYAGAADVAVALEQARRWYAWPFVGTLLARRRRVARGVAAAVLLGGALFSAADRVRPATGSAGSIATTLAVLPLTSGSADPADEYYVDGITDALARQLGTLDGVRVLATPSTMRYRGSGKAPHEVARELDASATVQGVVHRRGDRIGLDVSLIQAGTGQVLWSGSYERAEREVLALQAEVVQRLAAAVSATIGPEALERLTLVRAVAPDVYEAFLKGRYYWTQRTPESLELAVQHFERAIALDPSYAPAHAALADCFNLLGTVMVGSGSPLQYRPRAEAAALRALQIDPRSAEAHGALGYVKHYNWEWEEAERRLQRAIELNPSFSLARGWYANLLMSQRRFSEALEQVHAARALDPFSLIINTNVGWVLDSAGRHDDAIAQLVATLQMDPEYPQARMRLAGALMNAGRIEEALEHSEKVVEMTGRSPWTLTALAAGYARAGQSVRAETLLHEVLERSATQYVSPGAIGHVYLALGQVEPALDWLERAVEERTNAVAYFLDSGYAPLRDHPRFRALLARARLE